MSFRIAIIDQGIDHKHDRLKTCSLTGITILKTDSGFTQDEGTFEDDTGHGTAVASIIHKMVPDIPLVAIKLSSWDKRLSEDLLAEAIEYCLTIKDIRLINLSMGIPTETPSYRLLEACNRAERENVMIIAAAYNFPNTSCYPAHFPMVYGVSTGLVSNKFEYGYSDGPINILAKGTTQRVASLDNGYRISSGTSFATAHFSGIAATILVGTKATNIREWRNLIRCGAKDDIQQLFYFRNDVKTKVHKKNRQEFDDEGRSLFTCKGKAGFAKSIAVYPASEKEMKTILEFSDQCHFELNCLVDYPVRLISQSADKTGKTGLDVIRDINKIDFSSFDTLVCGYFLDQLVDANISFSIRLVNKCLDFKKNFICWDVDVYNLIRKFIAQRGPDCSSRIEVVRVNNDMYDSIKEYHNLPYLKTPVISIVGTSNRQGKITAQLRIKRILEEEGYKVSHISTEPQGILFGTDFTFPYGYKCPIEPPEQEWSRLMRIVLRGVQHYNQPDILITGTQGGLLPRARAISNELGHDLSSLHFLLGVQPDAICCAINPADKPEMILQTIGVIKSYCKSKLLFCFMTPWTRTILTDETGQQSLAHWNYLNREEMAERLNSFESQLSVPVIDIMDTTADPFILQVIQDAFTAQEQAAH